MARGLGVALLLFPMGPLPVLAQDDRMSGPDHPDMGPPEQMRPGPGRPDGGGDLLFGLARAEADQAASETIAALAKAPVGDVARVVRTWGVPTALRYFDVEREAFRDAVLPRLKAVVQDAQQAHRVSALEAARVSGDLDHGPSPHPDR